ncbi:MAG: glycosyltransferase, partial [Spirochaetia bacterium]|nr:glycosyltransferase [Spirochaetia bacterium]
MKQKRLLITGGGTGGHLSPGVAVYEEMKARELRPLFCAGKADSRFSIMDSISPRDLIYYSAPSFTKNILKLPFFLIKFFFAVFKASRIIRKKNIGAVLGMGGYVSAPALFAARRRKVPIFLCEQNSVPGRVTSMFEKKAKRIYGTFEASKDYLQNKEAFVNTGNPIRKHVLEQIPREEAKKAFHLEHCEKVVLLIGGSQGALRLNKLMLELRKKYSNELKNVGIIWATGAASYLEFKEKIQDEPDAGSIYLSEYIDKIGLAYRASDLAVSRS